MATMTRAMFAKSLQDGLNGHFGMEYDNYAPEFPQYMDIETSDKAYLEDQLMVGLGYAMETAEGAEYGSDAGMEGWTKRYTHRKVSLSVEITEEAIEDNRYMALGPKYSKAIARSLHQTQEVYGANTLNFATDTSRIGGDGKTLLATDHPLMGGGVGSNMLGTPADLGESSLEQILIQIRNAKDDRGLPIMLRAVKLVAGSGNEFNAIRLLRSPLRTGTPNNDINAIVSKGVFGNDPCIVTNLTDANAWFVKTDCPDGLKMINRTKIVTPKVTIDPKTGSFLYVAKQRYSEGHTNWRTIYGSMGAS